MQVTTPPSACFAGGGRTGSSPVLVLVAASFIDGMESNFIPGVLSLLQEEFHFGDTAAERDPDRDGDRRPARHACPPATSPTGPTGSDLLAIVVASWSVFTLASGLATTFVMFFAIRVMLGTGGEHRQPLVGEPRHRLLPGQLPCPSLRVHSGRRLRRPGARHRDRRRARAGVRMAGAVLRHGHPGARDRVLRVAAHRASPRRVRPRNQRAISCSAKA